MTVKRSDAPRETAGGAHIGHWLKSGVGNQDFLDLRGPET